MGYYTVTGYVNGMSTSYKSAATVTNPASPTRRIKVYELILGATAPPNAADSMFEVDLSRVTATGTGAATAYTPTPGDPADGAATTVANIAYTTEPQTFGTSNLYKIGMNQRATVRWVAAQESQYIMGPIASAASSGLCLRALEAGGFNSSLGGQISFME